MVITAVHSPRSLITSNPSLNVDVLIQHQDLLILEDSSDSASAGSDKSIMPQIIILQKFTSIVAIEGAVDSSGTA